MTRAASLPPIFQLYADKLAYVQRVSDTEHSSECPSCGGSVHPGGEWPDRCRWFLSGKPVGWCRRCGALFWPDADGRKQFTPEELAEFRRQQEAREEARRRSAERALAHLRDDRLWERYHAQLDDAARAYWRRCGIPDSYQDWWQLGWDHARRFGPHVTDTATIPLFDPNWTALNVKHRLIEPGTSGKYRYELSGCGQPPFLCNPEADDDGHVIAVEGEKKAMVTHITLDDARVYIVGLPGVSPGQEAIDTLQHADRITLVVDPGAREQAWALTGKLGRKRCRVLIPPVKIDDGILAAQMTAPELGRLLAQAKPAA